MIRLWKVPGPWKGLVWVIQMLIFFYHNLTSCNVKMAFSIILGVGESKAAPNTSRIEPNSHTFIRRQSSSSGKRRISGVSKLLIYKNKIKRELAVKAKDCIIHPVIYKLPPQTSFV